MYRQRRYKCSFGHTFNEKSPFASRHFQTSSLLRQSILHELRQHCSYKEIARRCHVSTNQVIRVFDEVHISRPRNLPYLLSIGEFKGNAAGQKYQVIITDPKKKRILDILPARATPALIQYFRQFPAHERRKVAFITMDMSLQFRAVMKLLFPKARILTKHHEDLTEQELIKLEGILHHSQRLKHAYGLKFTFSRVLLFKDDANISWAISSWLNLVKSANLPEINSLSKTFTYWYEEIKNALLYPYSNGFTEGCNNKIKVLKRVSFGLRNFERFRKRILYINVCNEKGHAPDSVRVPSRSA